jgi:hypothetical protein
MGCADVTVTIHTIQSFYSDFYTAIRRRLVVPLLGSVVRGVWHVQNHQKKYQEYDTKDIWTRCLNASPRLIDALMR